MAQSTTSTSTRCERYVYFLLFPSIHSSRLRHRVVVRGQLQKCGRHVANATEAQRERAETLESLGRLSVLSQGRPDEGRQPDPLLQRTYTLRYARPLSHVNFPYSLARCDATRAMSSPGPLVLRLYSAVLRRSRQSSPDAHANVPLRVIGSFSHTRVVSMLATSMRRLRSCSFPLTSRSIPQTRPLLPLS
jgi:hypothetical protein